MKFERWKLRKRVALFAALMVVCGQENVSANTVTIKIGDVATIVDIGTAVFRPLGKDDAAIRELIADYFSKIENPEAVAGLYDSESAKRFLSVLEDTTARERWGILTKGYVSIEPRAVLSNEKELRCFVEVSRLTGNPSMMAFEVNRLEGGKVSLKYGNISMGSPVYLIYEAWSKDTKVVPEFNKS